MNADIKSKMSIIGWYQLIGGFAGAMLVLYTMFNISQFSALMMLLFGVMLSFFGYSIFCGKLCLDCKANALRHSYINQLLQLLGFSVLGVSFSYVAGLFFTIGLDLTNEIKLHLNVGISKFDFSINMNEELTYFNFNVIAFAFIYYIDKLSAKMKDQKVNTVIDSIGT